MKNMKRFAALMMLLCALMICTIPAFAAGESDAAKNATEAVADESGESDVTSAKAMGSGLMIGIACLGGALAMGIAVADPRVDDDGSCVHRNGHHLRADRGDPHHLRPLMKKTPKKEGLLHAA